MGLAAFKDMNQGKIIEYIDQGNFICTLCLQDKGNKLHLLTPLNREVNLSLKRVLLTSSVAADMGGKRGNLLSTLKDIEKLREKLQEAIEIKDLWELVKDEDGTFTYKYLAQLCFGDDITDDHISALVRALFADKLYFKMKDGRFHPNTEVKVDQIIRQREEESAREETLREGSEWLRGILSDRTIQEPSCKEEIINHLIALALYERDAPNYKFGNELLSRSGIPTPEAIRHLLIKLGIWENDENLDLLRLKIPTSFSTKELAEAEKLAKVGIDAQGREDLRHLHTVTIDGPQTMDFDDALSMELEGDILQIGVHIADVAGFIGHNSTLYEEALERASSLYLPRRQVPMLPPNLSHDTLSLKKDCDRPAISLIARLDMEGNLLDYKFMPSLVRVKAQMTYDEVNDIYPQDGRLEKMVQLSRRLREKRIERGALILSLPEVSINIAPDASISLEMVSQVTPSRTMVAEFMILYNWLAAKFCRDHDVPVLYRCQQAPSEMLPQDGQDYAFYVFQQRRKLNPLFVNTEPKPHAGLGLEAYTNASSPIRRFLDIVIQSQIRNRLLEYPVLYDKDALDRIRVTVTPRLKDLERMRRNRTRYWIYKYLLNHIGEKSPAIVLDSWKSKYRLLLKDFLMVTEMKKKAGQTFKSGQSLTVTIKKADPWNDSLTIEYAGN